MSSDELKERTKTFAIRIIKLCQALPQRGAGDVISRQLLRSGTSIGANYRAACRGRSRSEFIAKLGIVVEEADETVYWLELLASAEIVPAARLREIRKEADELTAIFTAARKTSRTGLTS